MKKLLKLSAVLMSLIVAATTLPVGVLGVSAAASKLTIGWNYGYVGSATHSTQRHKLVTQGATSNYRYTDVFTVAKAGTKITFADPEKSFASSNVYVFSSWKQNGGNWELDTSYANFAGASASNNAIQKYASGRVSYEYVTSRDNENLRVCFCSGGKNDTVPEVYTEYVGGTGTYDSLNKEVILEGTPISVKWNDGSYMGSYLDAQNRNSIGSMSGYTLSDVITVEKAGTKLSWYDKAQFPSGNVLTLSSWKKSGGKWVHDPDGANYRSAEGKYDSVTEKISSNGGVTYSYVTSKDNENVRICFNKSGDGAAPTVYMKTAAGTGTWQATLKGLYEDVSAPVSVETGVVLGGKVLDVKWNPGYIGSANHASQKHNIVSGSSSMYVNSDVITVEKAGSTVVFFDGTKVTGYDGGKYASINCNAFTAYKKQGDAWVVDPESCSINCAEADSLVLNGLKAYSYTTTRDNESLRLSYQASYTDASGPLEIYKVWLIEPTDFSLAAAGVGKQTDCSYTDENGKKVSFKIYLPETVNDGRQHSLFVVSNGDADCFPMLRSADNDAVIAFCNEEDAANLTDKLVKNLNIRKSELFLIGSLAASEYPDLYAASTVKIASTDEAGELVAKADEYYGLLEGLTVYAMGDSYFDAAGIGKDLTWVNRLCDKYGADILNYGIGGSTVSEYVTSRNPMIRRISGMEKGDPDVVFLEGGRNDRTEKVPFGSLDSKDPRTYLGALNGMIDYLLETYPNALIICVTPWNYRDANANTGGYQGTTADYAAKMVELVGHLNNDRVAVMNMADTALSGVDMNDASFRKTYSLAENDVSHLNSDGHLLVLSKVEKKVAELYSAYSGLALQTERRQETVTEKVEGTVPGGISGDKTPTGNVSNGEKASDSGLIALIAAAAAVVIAAVVTAVLLLRKKKKASPRGEEEQSDISPDR